MKTNRSQWWGSIWIKREPKGSIASWKNDLTWRSFYDGSSNIRDGYGIFFIPSVFVIDHEGKIQWIGDRFNDALVDDLIAQAE